MISTIISTTYSYFIQLDMENRLTPGETGLPGRGTLGLSRSEVAGELPGKRLGVSQTHWDWWMVIQSSLKIPWHQWYPTNSWILMEFNGCKLTMGFLYHWMDITTGNYRNIQWMWMGVPWSSYEYGIYRFGSRAIAWWPSDKWWETQSPGSHSPRHRTWEWDLVPFWDKCHFVTRAFNQQAQKAVIAENTPEDGRSTWDLLKA